MSFGLTSTFVVNEGQPAAWVGNFADLPSFKIAGRILYTLDTNSIYMDINTTTRVQLTLQPYGASNGLSLSENGNSYNTVLGGSLIQDTNIDPVDYRLTLTNKDICTIEETTGNVNPNATIILTGLGIGAFKVKAEQL